MLSRVLLLAGVLLLLPACQCSSDEEGSGDGELWFNFDADAGGGDRSDLEDGSDYLFSESFEVDVPYEQRGGVKVLSVRLNGIPMDMILDTGASTTSISLAEAKYLANKGLITEKDVLGTVQSTLSDGSLTEGLVLNLRELVIHGDQDLVFENVRACVTGSMDAPLLLGNEILDRVSTLTVDNDRGVITFKKY